jgi:phosphate starvation-inducible PhoH-like protein
MSNDVTHRLSAEGADLLALAGVNDANLLELERVTGVRASLRGDLVTLAGSVEAVENAARVANAMIDLARMGEPLLPEDVRRLLDEDDDESRRAGNGDMKIVLPGTRRVVQPKTPGQREYVQAMRDNDIVIGIGPAGTGKTYLAGRNVDSQEGSATRAGAPGCRSRGAIGFSPR